MVHGHEREGRVHRAVHHGNIQFIHVGDHIPHIHRRPAHRVHTNAQAAELVHLDDIAQVTDVRHDKIVLLRGGSRERLFERQAFDSFQPVAQYFIGAFLHHVRDLGPGRATAGRVVFETAIFRRVMRRCDDHTISQPAGATTIVGEDGMRDHRCGDIAFRNADLQPIGREHFNGGLLGRF